MYDLTSLNFCIWEVVWYFTFSICKADNIVNSKYFYLWCLDYFDSIGFDVQVQWSSFVADLDMWSWIRHRWLYSHFSHCSVPFLPCLLPFAFFAWSFWLYPKGKRKLKCSWEKPKGRRQNAKYKRRKRRIKKGG